VGREADDPLVAHRRARLRDGHVVLPDVDAVRVGGLDEVGPVVEHEQRPGFAAQRAGGPGRVEDLLVGRVLLPELEDVDPVGERRDEHVGQRPPARARAGDEVQAGILEIPH
jgi:hypothetical protein